MLQRVSPGESMGDGGGTQSTTTPELRLGNKRQMRSQEGEGTSVFPVTGGLLWDVTSCKYTVSKRKKKEVFF